MSQAEQHNIECLEAEVRRLRQALRNLADSVIAATDPENPKFSPLALARAAKSLLGDPIDDR